MPIVVSVFVVMLMIGAPVGLVMVFAGGAGALSLGGLDYLIIVPDKMFSGVSSFVLIAVPYFIFTSELMSHASLTERLIAFNNALFGRIRGALSHVNITVSVFFAGLTGAAVTDTVSIGRILIPAMKEEGYSAEYSAAVTACSSIIGPIIPPSIIMVVYATILRDVSVIDLFAAGIIPGILMAGSMLAVSIFLAWRKGFPQHEPTALFAAFMAFLVSLPALMVPIVILGGILSGLTTVTEASAFAAVYTLLVGALLYRRLSWAKVWDAMVVTIRFSGVVFFLLAASAVLSWFVVRSGLARDAADIISGVSDSQTVQLLLVIAFLILLGTVMDVLPALVVVGPILHPTMVGLGFDSLHFAIIMIVTLNVSNITPPVGMTLLTAAKIAEVPTERVVVAAIPFFIAVIASILLLAFVPSLSLWLPSLLD
ncbi:TRAP transporter large permease [Shimia aestuarii]|uniref:TRAP transporter large permease protein n=1 Tax=Shimia aestuarii TaxID=254406 RepID=A0A1I4SKB4_9RHOB|nr:TRAP transporter large permease [Shimia aestuarii]SFM64872.1 TRAP transporter, DctM subunit [Shimia aestuarii]